ncbi:MYND-type domain-containing protein, partial [Trichostrongylus colubriformis]
GGWGLAKWIEQKGICCTMDDLIPNLRDERVQGAVKNLLVYSIVILLVPLGSMFLLKRFMFEDTPVYLGFGNYLEIDDLYRLRSIFLPLGKIGGKPSWLNPQYLPTTADLQCSICQKAMAFLIQIYATGDNDPPHAFHRALFIFICRDPKCSKINDASNIAVFRCCLPRENPFYSFDGPMDPDLDGNVADPHLPENAPSLCRICGCYASKKCGNCGVAWYCCRDHQALDWTTGHKQACGSGGDSAVSAPLANPSNRFLFKEYGIDMDQQNDSFKTEEVEAAVAEQENDKKFDRFNRFLNLNPTQVLRTPLLATDRAPPLKVAPPCERCGASRTFELQLMPHLLSLIGVDQIGHSIDWASVYVFTCSQTCEIENNGYAKEFVCKQDFC